MKGGDVKIAVCMKQTPATEAVIKITGNAIDDKGFKWIMNPYDEFAVEVGLQLKERSAVLVAAFFHAAGEALCECRG